MTFHYTHKFSDSYRLIALHGDVQELSGRGANHMVTEFINKDIINELGAVKYNCILDVGCGDASLLASIAREKKNLNMTGLLVGLLPSIEEMRRVQNHLEPDFLSLHPIDLQIKRGTAELTGLIDASFDLIICNSVLHGAGQKIAMVRAALKEFSRVAKSGCVIFIGEMPDQDELTSRGYGNSVVRWLSWTLRQRGIVRFFYDFLSVLRARFSDYPLIIGPKFMFYMEPQQFKVLLADHGFQVIKNYRHKQINDKGEVTESPTRWNYVAIKSQ